MDKKRSKLTEPTILPTLDLEDGSSAFEDFIDKQQFKNRTIFLFQDIDEDSVSLVLKQLILFERQDRYKEATLYINSLGGNVYDCIGLCDFMLQTKMPLKTIIIGKAMSAASMIALCGTKGLRFAYPNARLMFHELTDSSSEERYSEQKVRVQENKILTKIMNKFILKQTNITKDIINRFNAMDYYLSPKEALKYNIIDGIITKRGIVKNGAQKTKKKTKKKIS